MTSQKVTYLVSTVVGYGTNNHTIDDPKAWTTVDCPQCDGGTQMLVVAAIVDGNYNLKDDSTLWLRCVNCYKGAMLDGATGVVYPPIRPLSEPLGLPAIDAAIWNEVRSCLGVGAYAAAVMLCRKLLFHIAVAHGLPEKKANDRAPSFYEAVDHLQAEGLITPKMRPWVDRIKDVGNDANHEVSPISQQVAGDVAVFTEQLLKLAYEMDALMANPEVALATDE